MKTKPYYFLWKRPSAICFLVAILFLVTTGVIFAGNFSSPPTLWISSNSACTPTAYTKPLIAGNTGGFLVQYWDPNAWNPEVNDYGMMVNLYPYDPATESYRKYFYGDDKATESHDLSYTGATMIVDLSTTPGTFEVKEKVHSRSDDGSNATIYGLSAVAHYFVVNGPTSGEEIQITTDILFQGRVYANRNGGDPWTANAPFTNILAVVQDPTDSAPMPQYAIYMNGAASDQTWTGNNCQTLPNFLFPADGQPHDINVIIRSVPFTVTTGVSYRMNLNFNATVNANYPGAESYVDFFDPKLVTSFDFTSVKDQSGNTVPLSPSGFFLNKDGALTPLDPTGTSGYSMTLIRNPVGIDIMPWLPNIISMWPNWGIIPVTILSRKDFNAPKQVDQRSLTFGATGDEDSFVFCDRLNLNVNRDRYRDLNCYFKKQDAGFDCGDIRGVLKGKTLDGKFIEGKDSVKIIPCK